jgi:hypothetical protein
LRNAIGNGLQLWQQGKRTDDGQQGKSFVLPCRRSHAQLVESPFSLQGLREMTEAAESKLRADGGGELEMKKPPWTTE